MGAWSLLSQPPRAEQASVPTSEGSGAERLSPFPLLAAVEGRALGRLGFPGGPADSGKPLKVACSVEYGQRVYMAVRGGPILKDRSLNALKQE